MQDLRVFDDIIFVLVNPIEPGNIGSSCRAIKNMGFSKMRIVTQNKEIINKEAYTFAHNAEDVLTHAGLFSTLQDAVADVVLTVGTTRRKGKNRNLAMPVKDAVSVINERLNFGKVAVVFGREDRGLTNDEIDLCGMLLTIPCSASQPSLNLSHAVLLVAYELFCSLSSKPLRRISQVTQADLELFFERLSQTLKLLGYKPSGDKATDKTIMKNMRRFICRSGIFNWELQMLHGLLSTINKRVTP